MITSTRLASLLVALATTAPVLGGPPSAPQGCDEPGVTVRLITPNRITLEGYVAIELRNESDHSIWLGSGCLIQAIHEGSTCTGTEIPSPFSCGLLVVEIPPGEIAYDYWIPETPGGVPVPLGPYSLLVEYNNGTDCLECCFPVEVVESVAVPAMPAWGVLATALLLGLAGVRVLRRRAAAAA